MPLSANSVVFLEMTILAESGVTFFEHEKKVRAHFYCIPALCACISTMFKHFLCAFLLFFNCFPALVTVHFHCFGRLSGLFWTVFQHCLRAFLLHFYRAPALFSVRISTVFQHWVRAFLLICSTLCMHFYCISIAFLLHFSSTACVHFYYDPALFCVHYLGWSDYAPALFLCVFPLWSNTFSLRVFLLCSSIFVHAFLLCFSSDTLPTLVLMLFMFSNSKLVRFFVFLLLCSPLRH